MAVLVPIAIFIWIYVCFQTDFIAIIFISNIAFLLQFGNTLTDEKFNQSILSIKRRRRNSKTPRNKMPIRYNDGHEIKIKHTHFQQQSNNNDVEQSQFLVQTQQALIALTPSVTMIR